MNILVVDDKRSVRDFIDKILTALGHTVSTAVNGLDAFEKAQQAPFHLYIIDHLMPLMNGVTLSKNLKHTSLCAEVPILFMTTQETKGIEKLPEFNLFDSVIKKPLIEAEFIATVNRIINGSANSLASKIAL